MRLRATIEAIERHDFAWNDRYVATLQPVTGSR